MLWMSIWVHPHTVMPVQVGVDFRKNWGRPEPKWCCNAMVEAQTPHGVHSTSIWYVFKVFYHLDMLWMCIWVHPHTVTPVQVGVDFWGNWGRPGPEWCCNAMVDAQLPPGVHSTIICYVYKVFYHGWAYGSPLLHCLRPNRLGVFCKIGVDLSQSDMQSVLPSWYALNEHMDPPSHCYACAGGGGF